MRLPSEALWFRRMVDLRRSKPGHECGTGVRTFAAESQGQKLPKKRRNRAPTESHLPCPAGHLKQRHWSGVGIWIGARVRSDAAYLCTLDGQPDMLHTVWMGASHEQGDRNEQLAGEESGHP